MLKVGIVGGTFDPIHLGHLMLGRQAYEEYWLDEVWYMPSKQPPHKTDHHVTEVNHRFSMVHLAIADMPYFKLSDFELTRIEGNTYTADTLRLLKEQFPNIEIYFIVGADSIFDIEKWYHPREVLTSCTFLTAGRECEHNEQSLDEQITYLKEKYNAHIQKLHCRQMDISSEEIRTFIQQGNLDSIKPLVPLSVYEYLVENKLYTQNGNTR